jgi:ThiF family
MSQRLISRSDDLRRLRDAGYEVAIVAGHLVITHVPYLTATLDVRYGTLISELTLSGDVTARPESHVTHFSGERPCDRTGRPLSRIILGGLISHPVADDLVIDYTFSSRPVPTGHYADYFEKMTAYVALLGTEAEAIDPDATARTYQPVKDGSGEAVFSYLDTASSRAGISAAAGKLAVPKVAIVGLGGTGSYILDLLAKTPVRQIHLFDGDRLLQHNAFRSPGAPTIGDLRRQPMKVDYLANRYSAMHPGIVPHPYYLGTLNAAELDEMTFVFLAVDDQTGKEPIVRRLEVLNIPFVDVGIGVYEADGRLAGLVRTTVSAGSYRTRAAARSRICPGGGHDEGIYGRDIQTADLNALNAALAVIAWKKLMGFYNDLGHERFSAYVIDTNNMINDDHP